MTQWHKARKTSFPKVQIKYCIAEINTKGVGQPYSIELENTHSIWINVSEGKSSVTACKAAKKNFSIRSGDVKWNPKALTAP